MFLACILGLLLLLAQETIPCRERSILDVSFNNGTLSLEEVCHYGGPLTLSVVLPEWESPWRPLLEFNSTNPAELFLDGELIGHADAWDGYSLGNTVYTLPPGCAGRILTVETTKKENEPVPFLYMTDNGIAEETFQAQSAKSALPAAAFGTLSLFTLGLFLYGLTHGSSSWSTLLLSIAALSQCLYFHTENQGGDLLPPSLYGLQLCLSRAVLFALPPLYLLSHMKKRRRLFLPFVVLPSLAYFIFAGFQTVVPAFSGIAFYIGDAYFLTAAALVVCSLLEHRDGNPLFLLFTPGLGISAAGIGGACLLSLLHERRLFHYIHNLFSEILAHQPAHTLYWWNTLLLSLCLVVSLLSQLRQTAEQEAELQILFLRESMAREQLLATQEGIASLRKMRHETLNHYAVLQNLSHAKSWDSLNKYLKELLDNEAAVPIMTYTAHPTVNAILTTILARARKQGIKAEYKVNIPETLPFPDTELCTVLMNLLQNALEANALAPEGAEKWLRIDLHVRGAHLYIGVENSRFAAVEQDKKTGLCRTTKNDCVSHGYGLKEVQAVARKYQSELLLEFPEGLFRAATALQMPY